MKSKPCISRPSVQRLTFNSFDTDLPLLCNDEDLGESGLKSPPQAPSHMCGFVAVIKLTQILAFALRTLVRCKIIVRTGTDFVTVFNEEFKGRPGLRWKTLGTTHSYHP